MIVGALVVGILIDQTGILGPVVAFVAILLIGGIHTLIALRPRATAR
jgi:hypothetical protein